MLPSRTLMRELPATVSSIERGGSANETSKPYLFLWFFGRFIGYEVAQYSEQGRLRGGRMPTLRIGDILSPRMKAPHIEFATKFREELNFLKATDSLPIKLSKGY